MQAYFGDLVCFDRSRHNCFLELREKCFLINLLNDAEGRNFAMLFEQETAKEAFTVLVLSVRIQQYGILNFLLTIISRGAWRATYRTSSPK